jgi:hypothetical protein
MNKIDRLLEKKFVICYFNFSTFTRYKVVIKEIIIKHNKEIGWRFGEENFRNQEGEEMVEFRLIGNATLTEIPNKIEMLAGLIEDIYRSLGFKVSEEIAEAYGKRFCIIAYGKELKFLNIKLDPEKLYFILKCMNSRLYILSDVNTIIEIEKKYPKVVEKVYGTTLQSWYEREIEVLKKTFVKNNDLERAKIIVETLERSSNIKKIPYKLKKFRFIIG